MVALAAAIWGLASFAGCTRPCPSWFPCEGDCGVQGIDAGGVDARIHDGSPPDSAVADAGEPSCVRSFAACRVSYPDGPLTVPDNADVQEGDVTAGAGLLFMGYARTGIGSSGTGFIGVDHQGGVVFHRKDLVGFNMARIAWSPRLGLGVLARDSWLSWFDATGQDVGSVVPLQPDDYSQVAPGVGPSPDGFVVGAGTGGWDAARPVPPLRIAFPSGGADGLDWSMVDQGEEAYGAPVVGLDASGQSRLLGAMRWDGYGSLWRIDGQTLSSLMDLPGPTPYTGFPLEMSLAYYQGHAVVALGGTESDLWLARDDGMAVDLHLGRTLGALVFLDDALVLVAQDGQGGVSINLLSEETFGQIDETRGLIQTSSARSWMLHACATPRGIGMVWGGGATSLVMLDVDCCVESQ